MNDQYTYLAESTQITMGHVRSYRELLLQDHFASGGIDPENTIPESKEICREINANGGVVVLNNSGMVVGGQYITQVPEFDTFPLKELGNATVEISERRKGIATRASRILLDSACTALYCVVIATVSSKYRGLWYSTILPEQLGKFFKNKLELYGSLNGQILLANYQAHQILTSQNF